MVVTQPMVATMVVTQPMVATMVVTQPKTVRQPKPTVAKSKSQK